MRGFLVSLGMHAAGVLGLVVLPSFSASELPPPPPRKVYCPSVPVVDVRPAPPRVPAARGIPKGGGGLAAGLARRVEEPTLSDAPLREGPEEPSGEPALPAGFGSPLGSQTLGAPPEPPATPALVRAYVDVQPPRRLAGASPVYPPLARVTRTEGVVVLECTIGTDGRVGDVHVTRSHPLFDAAAVEAVLTWRYTPTLLRGVPVAVLMTVTVEFKLNR